MEKREEKILLVEDESMIRDLYQRQFSAFGFDIDSFSNSEEGFSALEKNHYDLVLLDIMLPGMNGIELLEKIKSGEKTKKIPVIMLTNLGQDSIIKKGFDFGASGYLIKARFAPNDVVREVIKFLEGKENLIPKSSSG